MENIITIINTWGSIASIIGLLITVVIIFVKLIKRYKLAKEEQENTYHDIQSSINLLANKATTATKRQDVFIYANESLGSGRHLEIRVRIIAAALYIISFLTFWATVAAYSLLGTDHFIFLFHLFFASLTLGAIIVLNKILNKITKINDSFSKGYLDAVNQHVLSKL